jgi:hypothetical protein
MKWGRTWDKMRVVPADPHTTIDTKWGGEGETSPGRQDVRLIRGRIVPCDSCKRMTYCAMFNSIAHNRLRHGEYNQGTNILHNCDIYLPNKQPGDVRHQAPHGGRTSGKTPT